MIDGMLIQHFIISIVARMRASIDLDYAKI